MSLEQIDKFIKQAKEGGGISALKVLGGEPLMHPQFKEIYYMLAEAGKNGIINYIKIDSNKTLPRPKLDAFPFIVWKGTIQRKKKHQPIGWSPKDLGFIRPAQPRCPQIYRCGYSLDKYGYLPCSLAIMLTRFFGLTHLYSHEFPTKSWGLDDLCPNCIFSMDAEWRAKYSCKRLCENTEEEKAPTKSFADAIKNFNTEEFYKTQKVF